MDGPANLAYGELTSLQTWKIEDPLCCHLLPHSISTSQPIRRPWLQTYWSGAVVIRSLYSRVLTVSSFGQTVSIKWWPLLKATGAWRRWSLASRLTSARPLIPTDKTNSIRKWYSHTSEVIGQYLRILVVIITLSRNLGFLKATWQSWQWEDLCSYALVHLLHVGVNVILS